jgi:ribosomal protein S13
MDDKVPHLTFAGPLFQLHRPTFSAKQIFMIDSAGRTTSTSPSKQGPKSEDAKAIDSLEEEELAQVEKTVNEHYEHTLNLYAKKLLENTKRINSLQTNRGMRESSSRPLSKKSNQDLKKDLQRLEAELAGLQDSLDDLTPTVQTLEDRYAKKVADAERRSRRSSRASPLLNRK